MIHLLIAVVIASAAAASLLIDSSWLLVSIQNNIGVVRVIRMIPLYCVMVPVVFFGLSLSSTGVRNRVGVRIVFPVIVHDNVIWNQGAVSTACVSGCR